MRKGRGVPLAVSQGFAFGTAHLSFGDEDLNRECRRLRIWWVACLVAGAAYVATLVAGGWPGR